ncbi:hypothetical protein HF851_08325 [Corynebacterium ammoniagenes]|uniref:hypothetical protein n=1 Tax=Corynebacterium ammoniagenes TaxID=1697 RepID=UPI0014599D4C|nr:hypothetical protein [Corynebacterium ammoniagenes]NMF32282.1 hypothetical protein [Corynebacterium ammoniagenes]
MDIDNTQVEEVNPESQGEDSDVVVQEQGPVEVADEQEEPDTFDRKYVESLRRESAKYRDKAKRTEELEQRLHHALVAQDGRLADPSDLEFNAEHLTDTEALSTAIGTLIAAKPGLKAQQVSGDVGAGVREQPKPPTTDLLAIMKGLI